MSCLVCSQSRLKAALTRSHADSCSVLHHFGLFAAPAAELTALPALLRKLPTPETLLKALPNPAGIAPTMFCFCPKSVLANPLASRLRLLFSLASTPSTKGTSAPKRPRAEFCPRLVKLLMEPRRPENKLLPNREFSRLPPCCVSELPWLPKAPARSPRIPVSCLL